MILQTERLILRPWKETDAKDLYQYAKDPRVGPIAGWPPHTSVENSRAVIRDILAVSETYAIVLKETGQPIGSIGLHHNDLAQKDDEAELGYWIGVPYWGRGLVPEAAKEVLRHAFEDLGLARVWCGYYDGNERSKRVQEKLGFRHQWTNTCVPVPQMNETRKGHVNLLTKEDWQAPCAAGELVLLRPSNDYAQQVLVFRNEMLQNGDRFDGCAGLEDCASFEEWIRFEARLRAKYQEGYVPSEVFLAIRTRDNRLVGIIDYRHPLSGFLLCFGGNIGYSVRPSERQKGYASEMLRLLLHVCRENGETRVLLACDKDNTASRKTILKNGGVLENEVEDTAGLSKSGVIQRYWISFSAPEGSVES